MPFHRTIAACAAGLLAYASVADAADRRVHFELINDSDAPIVEISVVRTSVFSNKIYDSHAIELDRPLAPGQAHTFIATVGEHHDAMPYAVRWRWTQYGSCQGGAGIPGEGDTFSARSGTVQCRNGKPLPFRRTDGRDALLAEARQADDIDEVRDLYATLLARDPSDVDVLHARAHSLISWSQNEIGGYLSREAIEDLEAALRLSTLPAARLHYHRDLAFELLNHLQWKEALPHLDALVAGQPDALDYLSYRASAHCELGDVAKATRDERLLEEKARQTIPVDRTCAARRAAGKG